jgi:hypothetical protein
MSLVTSTAEATMDDYRFDLLESDEEDLDELCEEDLDELCEDDLDELCEDELKQLARSLNKKLDDEDQVYRSEWDRKKWKMHVNANGTRTCRSAMSADTECRVGSIYGTHNV